MPHGPQHFPTFAKVYDVAAWPGRSASLRRLFVLERTLLRAALYALLAVSGTNYLLGRYVLAATGGLSPAAYFRAFSPPMSDASWAGMLFRLTSFLVEPGQTIVVIALCLVGLAASCRVHPHVPAVEETEPGPSLLIDAPPPPERHPLDPAPGDPPIKPPPWRRG